jgi:hypothetical protein
VAAVADVKVAAATAGVAVTVATMAAFAAPTARHAKVVVAAVVSIDPPGLQPLTKSSFGSFFYGERPVVRGCISARTRPVSRVTPSSWS